MLTFAKTVNTGGQLEGACLICSVWPQSRDLPTCGILTITCTGVWMEKFNQPCEKTWETRVFEAYKTSKTKEEVEKFHFRNFFNLSCN